MGLSPQQLAEGKIGWRLDSDQMVLETDKVQWPAFDIAAQWQQGNWQLALSRLPLEHLVPFVSFLPENTAARDLLYQLQPVPACCKISGLPPTLNSRRAFRPI